ncbi:MAG TPA: hypothetical protein VJL28_04070, partial [Gemmatimonadaceae bacterium]|nr:hypothetical protein [Gemmatimonadaceae bacterium]
MTRRIIMINRSAVATSTRLPGRSPDSLSLRGPRQDGYLPRHYLAADPRRLLRAYVDDYLKEEIAAEGVTRNLPAFASFLHG